MLHYLKGRETMMEQPVLTLNLCDLYLRCVSELMQTQENHLELFGKFTFRQCHFCITCSICTSLQSENYQFITTKFLVLLWTKLYIYSSKFSFLFYFLRFIHVILLDHTFAYFFSHIGLQHIYFIGLSILSTQVFSLEFISQLPTFLQWLVISNQLFQNELFYI